MTEEGFRERLDRLEAEKSRSYGRFEEHGEAFIEVMSDGVPQIDHLWASADEIYEASDVDKSDFREGSGNRVFTSIYNILCDAEVLDAFHDSEPYEINTSTYEDSDIVEAWEYVSGDNFDKKEDDVRELEEKDPHEVDNLYHELKD